jgi:hypothetical protein
MTDCGGHGCGDLKGITDTLAPMYDAYLMNVCVQYSFNLIGRLQSLIIFKSDRETKSKSKRTQSLDDH